MAITRSYFVTTSIFNEAGHVGFLAGPFKGAGPAKEAQRALRKEGFPNTFVRRCRKVAGGWAEDRP